MMVSRSRIPTVVALIIGVLLGWGLATFRPVPLQASATDRSGESIVATGPVLVRYDETAKGPVALDAVYYLDYKGGRLLATVPSFRQTTTATRLLEPFSERDLVADFKLELDGGSRPRFLMSTGSIGPDSAGWAPLYVFETTTSQVAVYRMLMQTTIGIAAQPRFELLEVRSFAKAGEGKRRP
jgi:hypothetical protein